MSPRKIFIEDHKFRIFQNKKLTNKKTNNIEQIYYVSDLTVDGGLIVEPGEISPSLCSAGINKELPVIGFMASFLWLKSFFTFHH